jgi:hypothetical protein
MSSPRPVDGFHDGSGVRDEVPTGVVWDLNRDDVCPSLFHLECEKPAGGPELQNALVGEGDTPKIVIDPLT